MLENIIGGILTVALIVFVFYLMKKRVSSGGCGACSHSHKGTDLERNHCNDSVEL